MISVCMATYNGEKFIYKQLESIFNQTMIPDEVIICDDCSVDGTVEIITKFIEEHGLGEKWVLYQNQENKGYPRNFYYAMELCRGDVVFLADQDDIWTEDKIECMYTSITSNSDIMLLASKWGIIDEEERIIKKISRGHYEDKRISKAIEVKDILYCYDWPGMSMCYKRELGMEVIKNIGNTKLSHDVAISLFAAENKGFYCMNQIVQYHRRHATNVAMEEHRITKNLNKKRKVIEIEQYLKQLDYIIESGILQEQINYEMILRKKNIMSERLENLMKCQRTKILLQYIRNKKDVRFATAICDWLICGQKIDK